MWEYTEHNTYNYAIITCNNKIKKIKFSDWSPKWKTIEDLAKKEENGHKKRKYERMIKVYIIKVQKRNVLKTSRLTFEDMKLNNTKKKIKIL